MSHHLVRAFCRRIRCNVYESVHTNPTARILASRCKSRSIPLLVPTVPRRAAAITVRQACLKLTLCGFAKCSSVVRLQRRLEDWFLLARSRGGGSPQRHLKILKSRLLQIKSSLKVGHLRGNNPYLVRSLLCFGSSVGVSSHGFQIPQA
jgi:hypothetical protein